MGKRIKGVEEIRFFPHPVCLVLKGLCYDDFIAYMSRHYSIGSHEIALYDRLFGLVFI